MKAGISQGAVALRASEVAERVAEFFSARLEDPASAEGIARDVAAAVVAGKRPATVAQRRKPLAAPRPKPAQTLDASQQSLGAKFSLRFAGEALAKEAATLTGKAVARGLAQSVCQNIRSGVFNIPAPGAPGPE
jgi:glycyl-tRNA synthetase beta subunit